MPATPLIENQPVLLAALLAVLLWLWRAVSVGMAIGRLVQEVKGLRAELAYVRERLDVHIDTGPRERAVGE